MKTCAIILAAGSGTRMGFKKSKTLIKIASKPAISYSIEKLSKFCDNIILAVREHELADFAPYAKNYNVKFVIGGSTRRKSVENCLNSIDFPCDAVLIHDGARPYISEELIKRVLEATEKFSSAIPALPVSDSVKLCEDGFVLKSVDREGLFYVQTPQGFKLDLIKKAYDEFKDDDSDDAGVVSRLGHKVSIVRGEKGNIKLTDTEDLNMLKGNIRLGIGYDVHRLVEERALVLCGVEIPYEKGLLGHSDADVAIHALCDALLGAAALGDIGSHFPDSDMEFKGVYSGDLLRSVVKKLGERGFVPYNVDVTIVAQKPKLSTYIPSMRKKLSELLGIDIDFVSVKATTTERLGFEGREEGISSFATATLIENKEA